MDEGQEHAEDRGVDAIREIRREGGEHGRAAVVYVRPTVLPFAPHWRIQMEELIDLARGIAL